MGGFATARSAPSLTIVHVLLRHNLTCLPTLSRSFIAAWVAVNLQTPCEDQVYWDAAAQRNIDLQDGARSVDEYAHSHLSPRQTSVRAYRL